MNTLSLICDILVWIILFKAYLFLKKKKEILGARINDIIITKDNKIGILTDYRRNFDRPDIEDDIIYEIKDVYTGTIQTISKNMVCRVIKGPQNKKDW